jgi:hypothetical protein
MANPTTNYGFVLPTPTDLVTDLPADFDVALQGVDTRLKALQPGTTLGDLAYSSATANTNTRLPIGTNGQVLAVVAGVPAWQNGTTGDIEGVTAGVGITGGGTSGTVTITNDMATTITASGDIVVGTGSGTYDNLPIGTTNQVLTADTTVSPYKVKWATPSAGAFTLIATATPSAASTFSFTSIPSTYKHLFVLVPELRWAATGQSVKMRFATGSYYSSRVQGTADNAGTFMYSTERGETYFGQSSQLNCPIQKGYTSAGVFGDISSASAIWIYDYTNTADRVVVWNAGGNGGIMTGIGIYDHTAVISNIDFLTTGSTVTGTAYLYGVS